MQTHLAIICVLGDAGKPTFDSAQLVRGLSQSGDKRACLALKRLPGGDLACDQVGEPAQPRAEFGAQHLHRLAQSRHLLDAT
jgi:hypothetical protein